MTVPIALAALLSHWRRKPVQLMTLLIGLSMATALWSGVQAINTEARASYARASAALGGNLFSSITNSDGTPLSVKTFVRLQRAGWRTSPLLEGRLQIGSRTMWVIGIEPLTAPPSLWERGVSSDSKPGTSTGKVTGLNISKYGLVGETNIENTFD